MDFIKYNFFETYFYLDKVRTVLCVNVSFRSDKDLIIYEKEITDLKMLKYGSVATKHLTDKYKDISFEKMWEDYSFSSIVKLQIIST